MTQTAVKKQIDVIIQATKKATKSKETAIQFLVDAGIIDQPSPNKIGKAAKKSIKH